jgi:tetratricopeptide (TPR) repeat protein
MLQENKELTQKAKKKPLLKLLAFIGICCCLQFLIVGLIGVIRGYTTNTILSDVIFVVGLFFILPYYPRQKRPDICIYFISFMIVYTSLIGLSQGRYIKKAEAYYSAGQYQQALQTYEKEVQTWYHLLKYNYHERIAMNMIAKTYCQLEDFDSAHDTYNLMLDRYSGEYYAGLAQERLVKLEKGLKIVACYPEQVPETKGVPVDLYDIAITYQYDLNCHTKAREVYKRIIDMDIPDDWKELAKDAILSLPRGAEENRGQSPV